jgi:hypothetical protein
MITLYVGRPELIEEWIDLNHHGIIPIKNFGHDMYYKDISFERFNEYKDWIMSTQSMDVINEFILLDNPSNKLIRVGKSCLTSNNGKLIGTEYTREELLVIYNENWEIR